ncbi:MAG: recombinase family protein [Microcoleus sp.]
MAYVPLRKAVEFLGLHPHTLRKYADEGKIKSIKNEAGQRLYDVESYQRGAIGTTIVCYCRVSSPKQRDDLARQVDFMRQQYPDAEITQDIGSGLNFKRKGLQALLVRFMRGEQLTVVVVVATDCVDSDLNYSSSWPGKTVDKSWFSTELFTARKPNSQAIFLPSFTATVAECTGSEVTARKSRKIRLFLNPQQKALIKQ